MIILQVVIGLFIIVYKSYEGKTQMIILWQLRLTKYETLNIWRH